MVDRHNWQHIVRLGFWSVQLYADVTLQLFFIATSITGWIHWLKGQGGDILPVRRTQASHFFLLLLCAVVVAGGYGFYSTPLPMPGHPGWIR